MSSVAEDQSADIALGYSASSSSVYPAVRFTGRVPGDALGTMETEASITPCVNGSAVAAGATCEVKVTFTPTQTGARTGAVTFADNASNSPQQLPLSGTGK